MEDTNNFEGIITRNSLKYLSNVDYFLNNYKDGNMIRCYYLQKFKKQEAQQKSNLPAKLIKSTVKCPKCYITRTPECTFYRICKWPQQCRFDRRLVRKMLHLKRLTAFQGANIHKMRNYQHNKLLIQCLVCNTTIEEELNKLPVSAGSQGKIFKKDDPVQAMKQPIQLHESKKCKGMFKKEQKNMNRRITKNRAKTTEKFITMMSSKHRDGKSSSLKDFLKSL